MRLRFPLDMHWICTGYSPVIFGMTGECSDAVLSSDATADAIFSSSISSEFEQEFHFSDTIKIISGIIVMPYRWKRLERSLMKSDSSALLLARFNFRTGFSSKVIAANALGWSWNQIWLLNPPQHSSSGALAVKIRNKSKSWSVCPVGRPCVCDNR